MSNNNNTDSKSPESTKLNCDENLPSSNNAICDLNTNEDGSKETHDLYSYTKREEFTSEIFKIEIGGLPVKFGYGQLKKLLNQKLKLKAHKIKNLGTGSHTTWAFVTFGSEEDRETALKVLDNYKWKGKFLTVKKASPAADPLAVKRKFEEDAAHNNPKKKPFINDKPEGTVSETLPPDIQLKNAVMPLWKCSYEEQLEMKTVVIKQFLGKLGRQIEKVYTFVPDWLQNNRKMCDFMCCPLENVRGSPQIVGYRNKCEFTIGLDPDEAKPTVGFRLARYAEGCMGVVNANSCSFIPDKTKQVAELFENYVRSSNYKPFDPENHTGHWRQLTVRVTTNNDAMAIVQIHPQNLSEEELQELKSDLVENFIKKGAAENVKIDSLYFHPFAKRSSENEESNLEHLYGDKVITETILGLKFTISPDAFFQVNSGACEVLYKSIAEMAPIEQDTVVLDICCGTGTIGLCLASKAKKIIGIEMISSAVENAKLNAETNNITNVEFICNKIENAIHLALSKISGKEVIAIIDPPRAGIHSKVIKALRACRSLKRLLYVSCDPSGAITNLTDLCRPTSNQYREDPFVPQKALPVDLFPHTRHCELVMLFER